MNHEPTGVLTSFLASILTYSRGMRLGQGWGRGDEWHLCRKISRTPGGMNMKLMKHQAFFWLVVWTPLKNISQLGWLFPIYGKIKNVPNHQPVLVWVTDGNPVIAASTPWSLETSSFKLLEHQKVFQSENHSRNESWWGSPSLEFKWPFLGCLTGGPTVQVKGGRFRHISRCRTDVVAAT